MTRQRRDGYATPPDNLTRGAGYRAPETPFEMPTMTPEQPVDVPVLPRFEIFAVRPTGVGTRIHLFSPGYQPGKKARHPADVGMCNGTGGIREADLVPLADALGWTDPHGPCEHCATQRPAWHWCHVCLGHALAVAGLAPETAIAIADRQTATARGAP